MRDNTYISALLLGACVLLLIGLIFTGLELAQYSGKVSDTAQTQQRTQPGNDVAPDDSGPSASPEDNELTGEQG